MRIAIVALALLAARAGGNEALPDLPVKGRPPHFDEELSPIGSFAAPAVRAEPTEVQAGDPLTFRVRITATGPVLRPPARPRLEDFPDFPEQFDVEDVGAGNGRLDERTWEFTYRLRPRHADVKAIPSFPFVFFTPGILPVHRGYQTHRTEAVELTVRPRQEVKPSDVRGQPVPRGPDSIYQLAEASAVLRRQRSEVLPGAALLALLLLVPPLASVAWYVVWRRRYPNAARLTRQRRGRAAERALRALRALAGTDAAARAEQAAAVMTAYLRQRLDLPGAQPTPAEVAAHLTQAGVAADLADRAAEFFRACDRARFAPHAGRQEPDLVTAAAQLVDALEARPMDMPKYAPAAPALALLGLLLAAHPAAAETAGNLVSRAETAFHEGLRLQDDFPDQVRASFRDAAGCYEELRAQGYANAALFRNEGNAWLLGGDRARAILAYRRGLRLAPGDGALREGLAHARVQVVHPAPGEFGRAPVDHRPPWLPRLTPAWFLALAFAFYSVACLAFARWGMVRRGGLLAIGGAALVVAVLLGAVLVVEYRQAREQDRHPLVVIAEDGVLLYKGNGLAYPRHEAPLNAGVEARLLFVRGDWLQIELAGGEVGWVVRRYALVDAPAM